MGVGHQLAEKGPDGGQSRLDRGGPGCNYLDLADKSPDLGGITNEFVGHETSPCARVVTIRP
jgi:hypothetical protein